MKRSIQVLRAARKLIEKRERWCQGAYNKDAAGIGDVDRTDAVSWCAEGAIFHVKERWCSGHSDALALMIEVISCDHLPAWNDQLCRKHSEVLEAFDRAIAAAKAAKP